MKHRLIEVANEKGDIEFAQLLLCEDCGQDLFNVFVIDGHTHLQCASCTTVFCHCDDDPKRTN